MEISGFRQLPAYTGEEKYQMLELNKRLESYLNHVKLLEEENQLLWREIQAMRKSQDSGGQRKAQDEELRLARKEIQNAWKEKDCMELEISNLLDEIEKLNALRQQERAAQTEAKRKLEKSRKILEDEQRMQIWLKEKAAHLEREVSLQVQIHQEDMAALKSSLSVPKPVSVAPQHSKTLNLQTLGEEYSQKAAQTWWKAVNTYQIQTEKLEESLNQARALMTQVSQDKRESQLQVQGLAKELESLKVKKELLEKNMAKLRESQNTELQHFQAHIETLEAEKMETEEQIDGLLIDRHNLLRMKMSLGLEVATYRALLDNESLRTNNQSTTKAAISVLEGITRSHGTHPGISSCLFSSPLSTVSRSISHKPILMTQTPLWPLKQSSTQEKAKKLEEEEGMVINKTTNLQSSPATLERPHKEASYAAVDKPDSILSTNVKEDLFKVLTENETESQHVLSGSNQTKLISLPDEHVTSLQTPVKELSFSLHTYEGKNLDNGDEEEIEMSTEMAQISHAPMSVWEDTDTAIAEERGMVSELELDSENIAENSTHEFRLDDGIPEFQHFGKSTNAQAPPLSAESFSHDEETSGQITWADGKENVIHCVEDESLNNTPEIVNFAVKGTEEVEDTGMEVLKGPDFDTEEQIKENAIESVAENRESEQRTEVEMTNGTEQERMRKEVIDIDNNDKDLETISNNSTQEFGLDNVLAELVQPSESSTTLVPSLIEETPRSAHTVSPDEETSEVLTWADVKENVICFVEEESLGINEDTGADVLKGQDFYTEEHEEKKETDYETKDKKVNQTKVENVACDIEQKELIEEVSAVMDNNEKESKTQSFSAAQSDPDGSSQYLEQKAGLVDTNDRAHQLVEYHAEEEHGQSEDESLNISASWRTDPGEADSYAQENTLADTRPLIHYRSDEEAEANAKTSHLGMSESTDSEDEGEKCKEVGHWSQKIAKRFDTMEDLSEEPELCNVEDVVTYGSVQTVKEGYKEEKEKMDELESDESVQPVDEGLLQRERGDIDNTLADHGLTDHLESKLMNDREENNHGNEEKPLLIEKQEESSDIHDWSKHFPSDTKEDNEHQLSNKYFGTKDNVESCASGSTEINPEAEAEAHFVSMPLVTDTLLAEQPQGPALEEPCEFPFETAMNKGQACLKEDEDERLNLSDMTDSFSQHGGLNSRPESNLADSEPEVSNSSEDESPNASHCSQMLTHPELPTQQLDWTTISGGVSENDSRCFKGFLKEELIEGVGKNTQEHGNAPQAEESKAVGNQNNMEKQYTSSGEVDENSASLLQTQKWENVDYLDESEGASHSILSTIKGIGDMKMDKDEVNVFEGNDLNEESQTREKENDLHSFFSSGMKESIWSTTQFQMAATNDPTDQTETEWDSRDRESLPPTNGKLKNESTIDLAQSVVEETQNLLMLQVKQLQDRDVVNEEVEAVQSEDSADDGDSWSSGDE